MTAARTVLEHAHVVQHDGVVARPLHFSGGRVADSSPHDIRVDLRDHVIFPGLINSHDHLQLNAVPPLIHTKPFASSYAWIEAFASHFDDPDVAAAIAMPSAIRHWHGGLKNLLAGATTVAHHDPRHAVFDDDAFPVGLLQRFGWAHSLGLGECRDGNPPRYGPSVQESFAATPRQQPWIIHLAEGTDSGARSELSRLDQMGCLADNTVLVHGIGLSRLDVAQVVGRGAAVVWCPSSNLGMFGITLAPRVLFQARRLSLGTDSRLTGCRDLLAELAVAMTHSDLSARELLRLVTTDASCVLRLPLAGGLAMGQTADCVIVRADAEPFGSLIGRARRDIRAVVRRGVPVIADPDFADWFSRCGVETVSVTLDGAPKLMRRSVVPPHLADLEPGLILG